MNAIKKGLCTNNLVHNPELLSAGLAPRHLLAPVS